jgi:hypothetical protein
MQVLLRSRTREAKLIDATPEKVVDLPEVRHSFGRDEGHRAEVR